MTDELFDGVPPVLMLRAGGRAVLDLPPVGPTGYAWSVGAVEGGVIARIETRHPDPPPWEDGDGPPDTWSVIDTLVVEAEGDGVAVLHLARPFGRTPPRVHRIKVMTERRPPQ